MKRKLGVTRRVFVGHGLVSLAALVACSESDSGGGGNGGSSGAAGAGGAGGAAGGGGSGGTGGLPQGPELESLIGDIGPLGEADANGVRLPAGFTSRIVARSQQLVEGTGYTWHSAPDGGATYLLPDGGWIYTSNSEVIFTGGVSALRFDSSGNIVDAYRILENSSVNCAGGKTPWGTWLSCEEISKGKVFECYPLGDRVAEERPALGVFKHEAVAVDPVNQHLFLTEDESDGRFYRFVPDQLTDSGRADLSAGKLQVAQVGTDDQVTWLDLPDPQFTGSISTRQQVPESTEFQGGEGIWHHDGVIYFSTKRDNKIWAYTIASESIRVLYDEATDANPILRGVDNLTVSASGDVLVAEDGGDMEIVAILPDGTLKSLMQLVGHDGSEVTGPAFDPSGTRLYFSSQRGTLKGSDDGYTFEISGPFHRPK